MNHNRPAQPADVRRRLRRSWRRLCRALNLEGDIMSVCAQLQAEYTEPWRAYHNLTHVEDCLQILYQCGDLADVPTCLDVETAIWFHDAVCEVGAADNEQRSAQLARACLTSLGASPAFAERVATLVLATDHQRPVHDTSARLICDIDLSILGRHADVYDRYAQAIFLEVRVPEDEYAPHRHTFLRNMLSREHVFQTDRFRQQFEVAARANMRREIAHWAHRLAP